MEKGVGSDGFLSNYFFHYLLSSNNREELGMHQIQFQSNPNPISEPDLTGFDKSWIWI
jgi:hypothetical protein